MRHFPSEPLPLSAGCLCQPTSRCADHCAAEGEVDGVGWECIRGARGGGSAILSATNDAVDVVYRCAVVSLWSDTIAVQIFRSLCQREDVPTRLPGHLPFTTYHLPRGASAA